MHSRKGQQWKARSPRSGGRGLEANGPVTLAFAAAFAQTFPSLDPRGIRTFAVCWRP